MAYDVSETISFFIPNALALRGARQDVRDVGIYLDKAFAAAIGHDAKRTDTLRTAAWPQLVSANFDRRPNMHEWWEAAKKPDGQYAITHFRDDNLVVPGLGSKDILKREDVTTVPGLDAAKAFLAIRETASEKATQVLGINYRPATPWNHFRNG